MNTDLAKERRFALLIGVVLLVYSASGFQVGSGDTVSVLGLDFQILRPEFVPLGLVLASLYAIYRYVLHGFFLAESPIRKRAVIKGAILGGADRLGDEVSEKLVRYINALEDEHSPEYDIEAGTEIKKLQTLQSRIALVKRSPFSTTLPLPITQESVLSRGYAELLDASFPTIFGATPRYSSESKTLTFVIPRISRYFAPLIDLDYALPVIVNVIALGFAIYRFVYPGFPGPSIGT